MTESEEESFGEAQQEEDSGTKRKDLKGKMRKKDKVEERRDNLFVYKPGVCLPNLNGFNTIRVLIASEYISRNNPEVQARSIWGNESYTSNSDLVCVLIHAGYHDQSLLNKCEGYELTLKITKPRKNFPASLKFGLLSRPSKGYTGNALKPEKAVPIMPGAELRNEELLVECAQRMHVPQKPRAKPRPIPLPLVPIPETHIVFNKNNEPAYKYSLFNIADHFQRQKQLAKRLDREVLYLEARDHFYELAKETFKNYFDKYRLSRVRDPARVNNEYFFKAGGPLPAEAVEQVEADLEWSDLSWGPTQLHARGTLIPDLLSFKFYKALAK
jgi:hypothetical protein